MKLLPKNVHFLCFEGGGGKGCIYAGAVKALGELGVLSYETKNIASKPVFRVDPKKIHGVSGTSIGALLALLIATGYTPDEIEEMLTQDYGIETLDKVEYGSVPTVYTPNNPRFIIEKDEIPEDKELFEDFWENHIKNEKISMKRVLQIPGRAINQVGKKLLTYVLKWYFGQKYRKNKEETDDESGSLNQDTTEIALNKLLESTESLNSLNYDLGFFLSEYSRTFADELIERKSGIKNCTFKQFYDEFQIDLVVTGFDIHNKKTLYFRNDRQWANLCVSDALRMSISIPFIFKPVYLSYKEGKISPVPDDLKNSYLIVDGGLGDNLPIHVFDEERQSQTSKLNPHVLGLRFRKEVSSPNEELTVRSYAGTIFTALLGQTSELQIRSLEENDQIIELEHEEVDALDFLFSDTKKQYIKKAYEAIMNYF